MIELSIFEDARIDDEGKYTHHVEVIGTMSDYQCNRHTRNERPEITETIIFAEGFTYEEVLCDVSARLGIQWYRKYGLDEFGNAYGVMTRIYIKECD